MSKLWDQLQSSYAYDIFDSLTSKRIPVLKQIQQLVSASTIPETDLNQMSLKVLKTYNYYQDVNSRNEALKTLETIIRFDKKYLTVFVKYIHVQVTQKSLLMAVTDYLTLLNWINLFSVIAASSESVEDSELAQLVLKTQAVILNYCIYLSADASEHQKHRFRVYNAVLASTRTSIIDTLTTRYREESLYYEAKVYCETILKSTLSQDVILTYLGVFTDAISDLIPTKPALVQSLRQSFKAPILEYFSNQVLLSKIPASPHALQVFGTFVNIHITQDDVSRLLLSNIEKAILRSSENSFVVILPPFFNHLSFDVHLDEVLVQSKLFASILSAFKSAKDTVRTGAYESLKAITQRFDYKSSPNTFKYIDEIFKALKTTSNTDHKALILSSLSLLLNSSVEVSSKVVQDLLPLIAKDQNETSLSSLVNAFVSHGFQILAHADTPQENLNKVSTQFKAGLLDKKLQLRRIWFSALGDKLYSLESSSKRVSELILQIEPVLIASLDEAQQSPLPTVANKGITSAFVTIALSQKFFKNEVLVQKSLIQNGDRSPLLTDSRVYTKFTLDSEFKWGSRALPATLVYVNNLSSDDQVNYALTWIYFLISANVPYEVRLETISLLKQSLLSEPQALSNVLVKGIFRVLHDFDVKAENRSGLNLNLNNLNSLLPLLTQLKDESLIKSNLCKLLVIANHASIPVKNGWVGLVQRSGHSIDIAALLSEHHEEILSAIFELLEKYTPSSSLYQSVVKSIGIIAFILPEIIAPIISQTIKNDLDLKRITEIDSEAITIWKGQDGELVIDVLDQSNGKKQGDKNSKDYEIQKWEESIKKELSNKNKGKPIKKLTKDEQAHVNEQLRKESAIRSEVNFLVGGIRRSLAIINELVHSATQVDNGAKFWYPVAISRLLNLSKLPLASDLVGNEPVHAFLNLSKLVSSRLGFLREFIGVATIRINKIEGLTQNYLEESLLSLTGRLLFRIKILADQNPLDSLSLSYILPLLTKTLEIGKEVAIKNSSKQAVTSEFSEEDPEEEQLLLSIEIIAAHSEAFQDESIPRGSILEVLISLMKLPSKAKLSKECFLSMCQHIAISYSQDDLKILLESIMTPNVFVRTAVLEGIDSEFDLSGDLTYSNELWIASHDNDANSAVIAATIWEDNGLEVASDAPAQLLTLAGNQDSGLRLSVAKAIVSAVENLQSRGHNDVFESTLTSLIDLYHSKKNPPPPVLDRFGLAVKSSLDQRDTWEERSTIALTLKLLGHLDSVSIERTFEFLVNDKALGDKEDLVRQELQEAGIEIIRVHGYENVEVLIPIFEANLAAKDERSRIQDNIKECVIILYGALARHLESSDPRLEFIIERLVKTLDTPSEDVQYAVSECLAPLVGSFELKLQDHFDSLFEALYAGKTFARRRGAAYGISGLVKGIGIKALLSYDIIRNLSEASDDKKNPLKREGVSFAFETLALSLGQYFEPYVIEILPILLKSLGDSSAEVREATDSAAKQIMKNTTSYGVKKLIPLAISNLDEIAWRSKKGSVELLGSMAYLDPAQLSASLSTIVPEIVGVLNDTHKEVRKAADQALKRFGEVIRNPEIQTIVPDLINAIGDPAKYTNIALDKLIKTQFVHYIDGPSLALIIHVIHRGMRDRSAATKKKACQIVGNMAILVDSKDLNPYLSQLVGELEVAMVDPVPGTRSTAARALGSLVEKLGEDRFPDLIPRLLDTLQDEERAGDRLGSAQALSEVICGLGINKLDELLPTILSSATSPRNHIRAGFMPLLLFLPVCFGTQFSPYLSRIIPPILNGLADTDEDIRDTALRAGRLIVKNYAKKAVDLLLPELEAGLSDSSYRIRLSSVELTGDLLFQITGITGKTELTEEELENSSELNKTLVEVLGEDRRDRVLASLFVCRSDTAGIVRNAAVDIWKALVANTPKTVKEILPSLTAIIVRRLASKDEVHRAIAAQTLGEMVRRVGANALARLLPTLEESLTSNDDSTRQGICIALNELIKSSQYDGLVEYQEVFIRIIREALVDSDSRIREAAAQAFESLQDELGKVVIDEILPYLLNMLESSDSENALLALQEIMASKSDVIFPILIPTLLTPPIDAFKAKALSSLASVAGSALYKRLSLIINTLITAVLEAEENEKDNLYTAFDSILLSIDDDTGVHPLMQQLLLLVKHEDSAKRAIVYGRLGNFFANTTLDYSVYTQDMISQFILSLGDSSALVVQGTFEALTALVKRQPKESLERLVKPARQALELTGVKGEDLPGFQIARGPNSILPIFLHGLMYGTADQKEQSALGIADIIDKTPALNLKPFTTTITGPLIRVIGEKVLSDIKAAILIALNNMLAKIPQFLRPFIPQLQRTFVRSLSDATNELLRSRAVEALGTLIAFQPRIDSLVTELVTGARTSSDQGVKTSMLKAMLEVVDKAGQNMNETSKTSIMTLVEEEITSVNDKSAVSYARLVGSLANILSTEEAESIIRSKILDKPGNSDDKFCILSINSFLRYSPGHIFNAGLLEDIIAFVITSSDSSVPYVSDNATIAIGKLLLLIGESKSPKESASVAAESPFEIGPEHLDRLVHQLAVTAVRPQSNSVDTRRLSLVVARTVARFKYDEVIKANLDVLIPSVFVCVRDVIIPIKLAAEKAYLSLFRLIEDAELKEFNAWFAGKDAFVTVTGANIIARSVGDYTKRVAVRLAGVERERIEAGGDAETMYSDRFEDEEEVWTVG